MPPVVRLAPPLQPWVLPRHWGPQLPRRPLRPDPRRLQQPASPRPPLPRPRDQHQASPTLLSCGGNFNRVQSRPAHASWQLTWRGPRGTPNDPFPMLQRMAQCVSPVRTLEHALTAHSYQAALHRCTAHRDQAWLHRHRCPAAAARANEAAPHVAFGWLAAAGRCP